MNISNINLTNYKNLYSQFQKQPKIANNTQKSQVPEPFRHSSVMSIPSFGDYERYAEKYIKLSQEEMNLVKSILENYEYVHNSTLFFNCGALRKFKQAYPKLIGEKQRGFVFENYPDTNSPKFQIARINRKENSNECITFATLDKYNNKLIRYKIDFNGGATIYAVPGQKLDLSKGKFSPISQNENFLAQIDNELKLMRIFADNYNTVFANLQGSVDEEVVGAEIRKLSEVLNSKGLKKEARKIQDIYNRLSNVLYINTKTSTELKQEFFGDDYKSHSKKMLFRHIGKNDKIISFTPANSSFDNRLFRIGIYDKNKNYQNTFVFFDDGRVAKQRVPSLDKSSFENTNLIFVSDDELKENEIKTILNCLEKEFNRFYDIIIEKYPRRKEILEKKVEVKSKKAVKEKTITSSQKKKTQRQNRANSLFLQTVAQKELRNANFSDNINEISEKDFQQRIDAKQKLSEQYQPKIRKYRKSTTVLKPKTEKLQNIDEQTVKEMESVEKPISLDGKFSPYYSLLTLGAVVDKLNNLFATPVEKRSPHLIHEKLSNGNIFTGRVTVMADDGAKISVSRVKSAKYVDFVYYSIRINKDGNEMIFNLDPEMGKIILSENGKPVIDSRGMVKYISKSDYRRQNPLVNDLPEYLNQLFEVRDNQKRKFIKNVSSKSLKQKMIEKLEKQFIENPPRESFEL